MNKRNQLGIIYFFIHMLIEITSFYILTSYLSLTTTFLIALIYDLYAFVPQGLFGYLIDEYKLRVNYSYLGCIIAFISLVLLRIEAKPILVIIILAIGNALVHVSGAEDTLKASQGRLSPSALFVSGGSFGLITGKLLALYHTSIYWVGVITLLIIPLAYLAGRIKDPYSNIEGYHYASNKYPLSIMIILATSVVIIRAYMGYGIPTTWNKTILQTILLYVFMGVGKGLGGILIDHIGMKKTAFLSTIGALPFLLFGDKIMIISLVGIMLFSMTMAITLGLLVSLIPKYPGVAFGFTTLGLFLGTVPIFIIQTHSLIINCIIVSIGTVYSAVCLYYLIQNQEE